MQSCLFTPKLARSMPYAAFKTGLSLLLASMLCVVLGSAAAAQASAPFAYKMYVTPEAGPEDPVVERRYTPEFAACQGKAQITRESAQCFEDEFDRQDARLNQAWKAALVRLPKSAHPALLAAQRRWIAKREPFCKTESDGYAGGTIAPVVYSSCRVELTIRRTIWLEGLR